MASATGSDHTPSSSPNPGSSCDDSSRTNLIINYLPQNLTESELFKMFVTIGTVTNCKIMRDFRVTIINFINWTYHLISFEQNECYSNYRLDTATDSVSSTIKKLMMLSGLFKL